MKFVKVNPSICDYFDMYVASDPVMLFAVSTGALLVLTYWLAHRW